MPSNPFSSDYAGVPPTQAPTAPVAPVHVAQTEAATELAAGIDAQLGFKITPIPMASGKPRRVIIKGKVTRD